MYSYASEQHISIGCVKYLEKKNQIGSNLKWNLFQIMHLAKEVQEYRAGKSTKTISRISVVTMILCKAMYCSKIHYPIPQKDENFTKF